MKLTTHRNLVLEMKNGANHCTFLCYGDHLIKNKYNFALFRNEGSIYDVSYLCLCPLNVSGTDRRIFMELGSNVTPSESAFIEISMAAVRNCALCIKMGMLS
jgi:hypothetical protein